MAREKRIAIAICASAKAFEQLVGWVVDLRL